MRGGDEGGYGEEIREGMEGMRGGMEEWITPWTFPSPCDLPRGKVEHSEYTTSAPILSRFSLEA